MIDSTALKTFLFANPKYGNEKDGFLPTGQISNMLVTPVGTQANKVSPPQIPVPVTGDALIAAAPKTMATICTGTDYLVQLDVIGGRVREQDNAGIMLFAQMLSLLGKMPQDEFDAVSALTKATQNDPSWQANVVGPSDLETQFGVSTIDDSVIDEALGRK